jgi:hypothetical protein
MGNAIAILATAVHITHWSPGATAPAPGLEVIGETFDKRL